MTFTINDTGWRTPNISRKRTDDGTPGPPITIKPVGMLLHTCEGVLPAPRVSSLPWLVKPGSGASCHYYVCRNGEIFQLAEDYHRTWHAGVGDWPGISDGNTLLGVEIEHRQGQDWPAIQGEALTWLVRKKIDEYTFPHERILAHRWWARNRVTNRRTDPTDWPDSVLKSWIANLYAPDWYALWGGHAPYNDAIARHGIPTRWRQEYAAGRPLGMALAPEAQTTTGLVYQPFEHGFISWSSFAGTRVWREQL